MPDLLGTIRQYVRRRHNHSLSTSPWFYKELDLAYGVIQDDKEFIALRRGVLVAREDGCQEFTFRMGFASRLSLNDYTCNFGGRDANLSHNLDENDPDWRNFTVRFAQPVAKLTEVPFMVRLDLLTSRGSKPPDRIWQWHSGYAVDSLALRVTLPKSYTAVRYRIMDGTPDTTHEEEIPCDPISRDFRKDIFQAVPNLTYRLTW